MIHFRVFYSDEALTSTESNLLCFECEAEDDAHAREQCEDANPGCIINRVLLGHPRTEGAARTAFYASLAVGTKVWWRDPDRSLSSCLGDVDSIACEPGDQIVDDTIVSVRRRDGTHVETYAQELHNVDSSDRRFVRTRIVVEVLSEDPLPSDIDLAGVAHEITVGDSVGRVQIAETLAINAAQCSDALVEFHSEPSFFGLMPTGA